jgi:predicted secreted protein
MSVIAADLAALSLLDPKEPLAGLTRHVLRLSRPLTDRSGASAWSELGADQSPAGAELRAEGVFLPGRGQSVLRELFMSGQAETLALDLPGEGQWSGAFLVHELTLRGEAEGEERFAVRLRATGPLTFQPATDGAQT